MMIPTLGESTARSANSASASATSSDWPAI
jgi:hypothetical protein